MVTNWAPPQPANVNSPLVIHDTGAVIMTDEELKQLIQETMSAQYQADSFSDDMPSRATPHAPAKPQEIARFADDLRTRGLSLPPSFAQFLRIHNGIENYIPSMELSLRSMQQIERASGRDSAWKEISPAHRFVFASGNTSAFAGFVPETEDQRGEMQVVMITDSGDITNYKDFEDFMKDQLEYYRSVIRAERADRDNLKDD